MAELTFIPFDGRDDSAKKRKKREAVRVHVMKNFHRQRKRQAAGRRISPTCEAWDAWPSETIGTSTILNEAPIQEDLEGIRDPIYDDVIPAAEVTPDYFLASLHQDRGLLPRFSTSPYIDQRKLHLTVETNNAVLCINYLSKTLKALRGCLPCYLPPRSLHQCQLTGSLHPEFIHFSITPLYSSARRPQKH